MATNIKRDVSDDFKSELEKLIFLAGFNKDNLKDLKAFSELGGGAGEGISEVKINWVLKDGLVPREDFLYCLAEIAIKVMGVNYYFKQGILNPKRYELNRFLLMCGYAPQIGNIFPANEKFRRFRNDCTEKYVETIPNIFWDITIPFEEALTIFNAFTPNSGLEINISESINLSLKRYNYEYVDGVLQAVELTGKHTQCEALSFKLTNTERKMRFKTIEAVRQLNSSLIPITLINGNWVDVVGKIWLDDYYDLAVGNHFNYLDLYRFDSFFYAHPSDSKDRGVFDILDLNKVLISNSEFMEIHKKLTLKKETEEQ